jgi:hypothetical protein
MAQQKYCGASGFGGVKRLYPNSNFNVKIETGYMDRFENYYHNFALFYALPG